MTKADNPETIQSVCKKLPNITDKAVSGIVKQVLGKKIWISLHIHQLLEIVKPKIQQDIINLIVKPDISQRNHIPCKTKRKKKILNDTTSSSSSSPSSGLTLNYLATK